MRVFDVSCPPGDAVARCVSFWRAIGVKRESTRMFEEFADRGWAGTEVTVMPGQANEARKRDYDTLLDLGELAPGLALGGLAVYLTSKAVRAQLRHLGKTRIIVAARTSPEAERPTTELWCFPWDTLFQSVRPGRDPFARAFDYLHTSLFRQGVLLGSPRLVDAEELPEDHVLAPANLARMRGRALDSLIRLLPGTGHS